MAYANCELLFTKIRISTVCYMYICMYVCTSYESFRYIILYLFTKYQDHPFTSPDIEESMSLKPSLGK